MESALIFDAVQLFTTSIYNLSKEFEINETPTPCNSSLSWKHGFTLINYMKMAVRIRKIHISYRAFTITIIHIFQKEFKGLTGKIKFDQEGFRTDIELELVDLTQNGLRVTGTWNTKTGINVSTDSNSNTKLDGQDLDLKNMSFIVITALVSNFHVFIIF